MSCGIRRIPEAGGLTAGRIRCLRALARHFLVWLDQEDIEIGVIDDAVLRRFRRHDCRCTGMERERRKMLPGRSRKFVSGALRLVRFFEHTRRVQHPGELDEGLRLLEEFLAECAADGYTPDSIMGYRSACRHVLVWLHQSRIPMRRMDAEVLTCFVEPGLCLSGAVREPAQAPERCTVYLSRRAVLEIPCRPGSAAGRCIDDQERGRR